MAFAAALSVHPVSALATGEVVGQLFEAVGPGADLVIVLATPGHRGALEDIVATTRRLLSPGALLAAVTTGLGVGEEWVQHGPGLAAWSGTCGPLLPLGPGAGLAFDPIGPSGGSGTGPDPTGLSDRGETGPDPTGLSDRGGTGHDPTGASRGRSGYDPSTTAGAGRTGFDAIGALVLGCGGIQPGLPGWPEIAVVAGDVEGPVGLDGSVAGAGPVGVVFGAGSGFGAAVAHGLRRVGPDLTVTRADGSMVYELDGQPALRRLIDVARDGLPAGELATIGARLHLRVTPTGSGAEREPSPVLGTDRANGALAVRDPVEVGSTVQFAVTDPASVRSALGRSMAHGADGAVVLTPAGGPPLRPAPGDAAGRHVRPSRDGERPADQWAGRSRPGGPRAGPRAGNPAPGNPRTGDPRTGDPWTGHPPTGDPRAGDPWTGDPWAVDPWAGDPWTGDPGAGDPWTGDPGAVLPAATLVCATALPTGAGRGGAAAPVATTRVAYFSPPTPPR